MVSQPKISIVLFCKNAEKFIETAIKSVIEQDYKNYELLVLDGKSTDNTVEIIQRYKDNIAYFHSKRDKGAADAQNQGLELCTGDLIVLLCADDWFEPGCFSAVATAFTENHKVDIISCGSRHIIKSKDQEIQTVRSYHTPADIEISLNNTFFKAPNLSAKFITKNFIKKIGKFKLYRSNQQYFYANDLEFLLRAILLKPKSLLIPNVYHTCLVHDESINFGASNNFIVQLLDARVELINDFLEKNTLTKKDKRFFTRWLVDTQIRLFVHYCLLRKAPPNFFKSAKITMLHPVSLIIILCKGLRNYLAKIFLSN